MSLRIWESALRIGEKAGEHFCDVSVCILLLMPLAIFFVWLIVCICSARARSRSKAAFLGIADVCLFLFAAFALFAKQPLWSVFALAFLFRAAYYPLYAALCLFRGEKVQKRSKGVRKGEGESRAEQREEPKRTAIPPLERNAVLQQPRMVRCYEGNAGVSVEQDVRLEHIFSVLERLKQMPLGAGDRLEALKYENLLQVYRTKGNLSPEEAQTLNDILASLLKMMAKYNL